MRLLAALFLFGFLAVAPVEAQRKTRVAAQPTNVVSIEARYGEALSLDDESSRLAALSELLQLNPEPALASRIRGSVVSALAALADRKLREGESEMAVGLFMRAIAEAPEPVSDDLFSKVLLQIPTNLFVAGRRVEAFDAAKAIESRIGDDVRKLVGLTTFFISVQYGTEAIRLAEKAVALDPGTTLPRLTLATALRLNFRLADAVAAYRTIIEIEPTNLTARFNLAELLRASGESSRAIELYRLILEERPDDPAALAGLAIALHGTNDEEAASVAELAAKADPSNAVMHASIAFHFLRSKQPYKALDSADRSIAASPTSVWGYIAKARAMRVLEDYDEAERLLVFAGTLADVPSLQYELASLRYSLGYFREAAETVFRSYDLDGDLVVTYLGNRILADSDSFVDLIGLERRATVADPMFASEKEIESRLKSLMAFVKAISTEKPDQSSVLRAAEAFMAGDDDMRLHREIFIAGRLLQRGVATTEALTILRDSVGRVEVALKSSRAASATLADDIYEARRSAFSRGERVFTPKASEQVLGSVLRGRLEELTGFAFLIGGDPRQAIIRLRRAVSVLPERSAWWNSAQWRLGNALEADGSLTEAAEAYIKTFDPSNPDAARYGEIERVWKSSGRTSEELVARIGPRPEERGRVAGPTTTDTVERKVLPEDVPFVTPGRGVVDLKKPDPRPGKDVDVKIVENPEPAPSAAPGPASVTVPKPVEPESASPFDSIVISTPKKDSRLDGAAANPCRLIASPSLVTVASDGSTTRIAVSSFGGDHREIAAKSASPEDIEIVTDSEAESDPSKRFFKARSLSGRAGLFRIMLTSPCGSRELELRVK